MNTIYDEVMGRIRKNIWLFFVVICFLFSCDTSVKHNHQDFEDLIYLITDYHKEIHHLEKKADECVDFAEAYKYATMARNLMNKGNDEIRMMFETMPKPVSIPVEQSMSAQSCTLSDLEVTSAGLSDLSVKATLSLLNPDSNQFIRVNLSGIDGAGSEIQSVLALSGIIKETNRYEVFVSGKLYNPENIAGLVNFKVDSINMSRTEIISKSK